MFLLDVVNVNPGEEALEGVTNLGGGFLPILAITAIIIVAIILIKKR